MSRAAKGAVCKSAGVAFVGSSPTSPTTSWTRPEGLIHDVPDEARLRAKAGEFMRYVVSDLMTASVYGLRDAGVAQW